MSDSGRRGTVKFWQRGLTYSGSRKQDDSGRDLSDPGRGVVSSMKESCQLLGGELSDPGRGAISSWQAAVRPWQRSR
jgi:hypothetical protein